MAVLIFLEHAHIMTVAEIHSLFEGLKEHGREAVHDLPAVWIVTLAVHYHNRTVMLRLIFVQCLLGHSQECLRNCSYVLLY